MKTDIQNRSDIQSLVDRFYDKVKRDDAISYLFIEVGKVDWEHHLPRMYDFWENIVFQTGGFTGNPMIAHLQLNQKSPLKQEHFARWLELFFETVDELFDGDNAELIKQRAQSIATMMQIKIIKSGKSDSIY